MGCECSREEGVKPESTQQAPVQNRVAIVNTVKAKPTGSKPLKEIMDATGQQIGYLNNISPTGFKSNNDPTHAYWIACLLAQYPKFLANIVKNNNGAYSVQVYNAGVPTVINVEDSYPVGANGQAFYTASTNGDVWPMVLEKALAQNVGGYDALFDTHFHQLWQTVLGVPVNASQVSSDNWGIVRDNAERGYPMALIENDPNTGKPLRGFTIVKAAGTPMGQRVVSLRDMFGNYVHDENLNNPAKEGDADKEKLVGYNPSDPRMYYFYFEDIADKFGDNGEIVIPYIESNGSWSYKYVQSTAQAKHQEYFDLVISKKCLVNISVHQLPNTANPKLYSDIHIEVLTKDQQLFGNFNNPEDGCKPTVWADYNTDDSWSKPPGGYRPTAKGEVEPGTYVIAIKARNPGNLATNFTVSTYSNKPVELKKCEPTAYGGLRGFLQRRMFMPNRSWNYLVNGQSFGDNNVNHGRWWTHHYYVFQCENNSQKIWNLSIKFPKLKNFTLGKPNRVGTKEAAREFKVSVPVGQSVLVYLKKVPTYERVTDLDDNELTESQPFTFEIIE